MAESQDSTSGTITFRDPTETDDGNETGGDGSSNSDTSVSISFGFEVDE